MKKPIEFFEGPFDGMTQIVDDECWAVTMTLALDGGGTELHRYVRRQKEFWLDGEHIDHQAIMQYAMVEGQ